MSSQPPSTNQLQFAPFSSSLHPAFWTTFAKYKLEVLGLDSDPVDVKGVYVNDDVKGLPASLSLDWSAFAKVQDQKEESDFKLDWNEFHAPGQIMNKNTLEEFKQCDKKALLDEEGSKLWGLIKSGEAIKRPQVLTKFIALTFADLKKYNFYYWFVFPALTLPVEIHHAEPPKPLNEYYTSQHCQSLSEKFQQFKQSQEKASGFCAVKFDSDGNANVMSLELGLKDPDSVLCFADPSTMPDHPGWPLRNLLALIAHSCPRRIFRERLTVICLRQKAKDVGVSSIVLTLEAHGEEKIEQLSDPSSCVGWEKNRKGALLPQVVNLRATMDPTSLAASSVDLNLKLMKWRLVPDLDLGKIAATKCLLLGSGTLGCNVARCLMGWGVRKITFVDNGKVSYSNPVRQSLFNFEDCLDGGKPKAKAASDMIKKIFPGVDSEGHDLSVPMPGHVVSDKMRNEVKGQYENLEELIKNHDVVFLLMDTRESRWLPTLLGAHHGKLVMNAALGFHTFFAMRHGQRPPKKMADEPPKDGDSPLVYGDRLGCYFCNDVVSPGDSMKDRTLDEQCTVTRPAVSYMAASLLVELMVSVLQHPLGGQAPASTASPRDSHKHYSGNTAPEDESILGYVPHSIRGNVHTFDQFLPTTPLFDRCSACSKGVLQAFRKEGFSFVEKVCNDPKHLDVVSGLKELQESMDKLDLEDMVGMGLSDEDDF